MDQSMDDFDHSFSGPSQGRPIGLGISHPAAPISLPDPQHTYQSQSPAGHRPASPPDMDASFGSIPEDLDNTFEEQPEEGDNQDEEAEEEEGEGDGASETSSAVYDPKVDPEGFARRQDELAGLLEIGEEEVRVIRQGPILGKGQKAPLLSLAEFKNYINHYLSSTEWKYAPPPHADSLLTRQGGPEHFQPGEDLGGMHPIRVLGRSWVGQEVGLGMGEMTLEEGMPREREEGRVMEGLIR